MRTVIVWLRRLTGLAGVDEARKHLEETVGDRERVERVTRDVLRQGKRNHFSERMGRVFRGDLP